MPDASSPAATAETAGASTTNLAVTRGDHVRLLGSEIAAMTPDDGTRDVLLAILLAAFGALAIAGVARLVRTSR